MTISKIKQELKILENDCNPTALSLEAIRLATNRLRNKIPIDLYNWYKYHKGFNYISRVPNESELKRAINKTIELL